MEAYEVLKSLREKIGNTRQYIEFLNAEDDTDVMEYETAKHDDAWAFLGEMVRLVWEWVR